MFIVARRKTIGEDDRKHCSGHLVQALGFWIGSAINLAVPCSIPCVSVWKFHLRFPIYTKRSILCCRSAHNLRVLCSNPLNDMNKTPIPFYFPKPKRNVPMLKCARTTHTAVRFLHVLFWIALIVFWALLQPKAHLFDPCVCYYGLFHLFFSATFDLHVLSSNHGWSSFHFQFK